MEEIPDSILNLNTPCLPHGAASCTVQPRRHVPGSNPNPGSSRSVPSGINILYTPHVRRGQGCIAANKKLARSAAHTSH